MGRKSLKETRQKEIIKTFYRVSKKEGLENASIAKTAAAMHINPSLIMHYFKTKEHLIYGLIEYILDKYLLIYKIRPNSLDVPENALLKIIDNIFSKKWNSLIDDGVSYSCYSMVFRDKRIKKKYKVLLDTLRSTLKELIIRCNSEGTITVKDPARVADLIFVMVDGAYYYLSLVDNKEEYRQKLNSYKQEAIKLLGLSSYVSFETSV